MNRNDKDRIVLLDILAFIAIDSLNEYYENDKIITTKEALRFLKYNFNHRFDYLSNINISNWVSSYMTEGKDGYIFAYCNKNEDLENLFNYVIKNKLKKYIDKNKLSKEQIQFEIEEVEREFHDQVIDNYSIFTKILGFLCDCYKIEPDFGFPLFVIV